MPRSRKRSALGNQKEWLWNRGDGKACDLTLYNSLCHACMPVVQLPHLCSLPSRKLGFSGSTDVAALSCSWWDEAVGGWRFPCNVAAVIVAHPCRGLFKTRVPSIALLAARAPLRTSDGHSGRPTPATPACELRYQRLTWEYCFGSE